MLIRSITQNAMDKNFSIRQFPSTEYPYIAFPQKNLAVLDISRFTTGEIGPQSRLYERTRIFKVQKKSLRAISSARYDAHMEPLFRNCNLLKIEDIHKVQQFKFFYKLTHKDLPEYFNAISLIQVSDIHDHITRNRKKNYTRKIYHKFAEKSIRHSIFHTLNDAPKLIRNKIDTHSFQGFSNYTKTFLLRKYSDQCQITNCYVCKN